jgi:hypothetical protein
MDISSSKWRLFITGSLSLALFSAPVFNATGQSQSLYPALDGNHSVKGLHHKTYRHKSALQGVNLAWAPSPSSPNIDGYRIYYGTASGNYSEHLDVGMVTNAKVPNSTAGTTYFYVVVAYKGSLESPPSNEVASGRANPAPLVTTNDTPSSDTVVTPRPTPGPGLASPTPPPTLGAAPVESMQPIVAGDAAPATTPSLRFQRRLQRLRMPSGDSTSHEPAGAAAAESAPK